MHVTHPYKHRILSGKVWAPQPKMLLDLVPNVLQYWGKKSPSRKRGRGPHKMLFENGYTSSVEIYAAISCLV